MRDIPMMSPKQDDSIARKREELQRFIDARGLKVRPWAERAGLSHGTVRNFLTGRSQTMTQATILARIEKCALGILLP